MTTNHTTATAKLPIGTRIVFLKTLESPATGDAPAQMYAKQGEFGEVTGHDCADGYWVKTDSWPHAFGAVAGEEFSPVESELTCLRAEIAGLRAEREAMAKQEPTAFVLEQHGRKKLVFDMAGLTRYEGDGLVSHPLFTSPVPIPEWQQITGAKRTSDQSVELSFTSCRAASAFLLAAVPKP